MSPSRVLREVIANRLRELMAARPDLDTQVKLSRRAGLSQSTIARILSADSSATADSIADLARAFGVSPASLLLADPAEIALLSAIQAMKPEARQRMLGYSAGVSHDQQTTQQSPQYSLDSSTPVPPSRRAAHAKAVARPIKTTTTQESEPTHAKKQRPTSRR